MTASVTWTPTRLRPALRGGIGYLPTVAFGLDLVLVTISVLAAVLGRELLPFTPASSALSVGDRLAIAGPAMILGWVGMIYLFGGHRADVIGAGTDEYRHIVNASLATAAVVAMVSYLLRFPMPRGFFVLAFAIGVPLLVAGRFVLRRAVHRARRGGALLHRVVIAGSEGHVDEIASVLRRESWLGYNVVGALTPERGDRETTHSGVPLLGASTSLAQIALDAEADVVFLAGGAFSSAAEMRKLAWDLEHEDVQVVIAPSVTDVSSERITVRPIGGLPLIHLGKSRYDFVLRGAKRIFDVLGALLLLVLLSPLMMVAAFRVRHHDHGPVFVRQTRLGRDGRPFTVWKFRAMVTDALELTSSLGKRPDASLFTREGDPRMTKPGRWLRRYSIDELPQLIAVLVGDMSLVGPRAPLAHEVAENDEDLARRLRVRPGITGLWRVSGRGALSWQEATRLDMYYVDHWSIVQDLTILARTIPATLGSRSGY